MDKFKELLANGEFEAKLNGCIDTDKVKALAKEYGTELTDEEAQQVIRLLKVRLSDDDLETVTGGTQEGNSSRKRCRVCGRTLVYREDLCYSCYYQLHGEPI